MDFNFNKDIFLQDKRLLLEPLSWNHFEFLLPVIQANPDLDKFSPSRYGSEDSLRIYFKNALDKKKQNLRYPFAIFDKLTGTFAGSTSFGNISNIDMRLEIGWTWIGSVFQRTGLNRHCKYNLLQYAFEILNFERVELKTDNRNEQSKNAIMAIGGKFEGILRNHTLMFDGHRRDTVYYGILKSEWKPIKESIFKNIMDESI
jgi:RimJ/RimL family protein N-acetyltransferase